MSLGDILLLFRFVPLRILAGLLTFLDGNINSSSTSNTGGDCLRILGLFLFLTFDSYVTYEWNLFRFFGSLISSDLLGCSFLRTRRRTSGEFEELDWYILHSLEA